MPWKSYLFLLERRGGYLNTDGANLTGGRRGSHANESWVLKARNIHRAVIPAFSGSEHARRRLMDCVAGHFAPFRLDIVTVRPSRAPYIMAVVGGSSAVLGLSPSSTGIAPSSTGAMAEAVAFAFEREDRGVDGVCKTVAHEVGHALGLKHAYRPGDIMSYLPSHTKTFMDISSYCGEYKARRCQGSRSTQNSHQHLAKVLGLKTHDTEPAPRPGRTTPVEPDDKDRGGCVAGTTRRPKHEPRTRPRSPRRQSTIVVRIGFGHGRWVSCTGKTVDDIRRCLQGVRKVTTTDGKPVGPRLRTHGRGQQPGPGR